MQLEALNSASKLLGCGCRRGLPPLVVPGRTYLVPNYYKFMIYFVLSGTMLARKFVTRERSDSGAVSCERLHPGVKYFCFIKAVDWSLAD
jgi:hypothetical protein